MSEIYYINKNTLTNIADAIRAATGSTEAIEVGKLGQRTSEAFIQKEGERDVAWLNGTIEGEIVDKDLTRIRSHLFESFTKITKVSFPECLAIGTNGFAYCSNLTEVSFPACTSILGSAFYHCTSLSNIFFPSCSIIYSYAFAHCDNLTVVNFPNCTKISSSAFLNCDNLTTIIFPKCTRVWSSAFQSCAKLNEISLPLCQGLETAAFSRCTGLNSISLPVCTNIGPQAFYFCSNLQEAHFPYCRSIRESAFYGCRNLSSLVFNASWVCTLSNSNAFYSTPYRGYSTYFSGTPHIYVPSSLIDSYRAATNWTYFSSYFKAIGTENEINFTIDGVTYTATNDMNWTEWCDSDYNTAGYYVEGSLVKVSGGTLYVSTLGDAPVLPLDLIIEYDYSHSI